MLAQTCLLCLTPMCLAGGQDVTFERHIAPIFETRCVRCHGGKTTEAGLDLRRRATILQGGDSGLMLTIRC